MLRDPEYSPGHVTNFLILICIFNLMLELPAMRSVRWTMFLLVAACGGLGNPGDSNSGLTTATPSWTTGAATDPGSGSGSGDTTPTTSGMSASMTGSTPTTGIASSAGSTGEPTTGTSSGTGSDSGSETGPPETPHPKLDLPPSMSTSDTGNDEDKDKDKDIDR